MLAVEAVGEVDAVVCMGIGAMVVGTKDGQPTGKETLMDGSAIAVLGLMQMQTGKGDRSELVQANEGALLD